jgi:hypothetical protein
MAYTPRNSTGPREPSPMKPINPFPLVAMLVIVAFLVLWLNGAFT